MIKRKPYDLINSIIPFPKDEWKRNIEYNLFSLFTFHELNIELKQDLEWEVDTGKISYEEIFEAIIKGENIEKEEKVILSSTFNECYEIDYLALKKCFIEQIYKQDFNDYFFIFPKTKLILTLDHHTRIGRCDFTNFKPRKKFRSQFRVSRIAPLNKMSRNQEIGNKYRYELLINEQSISKFRVKRASKELEKFGLIIMDLEEDDYPTEKFLLNKKQIKNASDLLNKYTMKFYQNDKQKDKEYLNKVKK